MPFPPIGGTGRARRMYSGNARPYRPPAQMRARRRPITRGQSFSPPRGNHFAGGLFPHQSALEHFALGLQPMYKVPAAAISRDSPKRVRPPCDLKLELQEIAVTERSRNPVPILCSFHFSIGARMPDAGM